jgi:glycosyl hydrolase family 59 (putative galactocerebrosidase)
MVAPCWVWANTITFAQAPVGSLPAQFESALTGSGSVGLWAVVQDGSAQGGRALEQRTPDRTDDRFPLAIYQPVAARDLEVSVRFKPVAGRVDQAGGIAIRLLDADNYYVVRANALEDNVRFYRVVSGKRQQIAGADTRVTAGEWHTLTLRAEEDRFTVSFDGRELFSARDRAFGAEGRVALWTKADSITRFEYLDIRAVSG